MKVLLRQSLKVQYALVARQQPTAASVVVSAPRPILDIQPASTANHAAFLVAPRPAPLPPKVAVDEKERKLVNFSRPLRRRAPSQHQPAEETIEPQQEVSVAVTHPAQARTPITAALLACLAQANLNTDDGLVTRQALLDASVSDPTPVILPSYLAWTAGDKPFAATHRPAPFAPKVEEVIFDSPPPRRRLLRDESISQPEVLNLDRRPTFSPKPFALRPRAPPAFVVARTNEGVKVTICTTLPHNAPADNSEPDEIDFSRLTSDDARHYYGWFPSGFGRPDAPEPISTDDNNDDDDNKNTYYDRQASPVEHVPAAILYTIEEEEEEDEDDDSTPSLVADSRASSPLSTTTTTSTRIATPSDGVCLISTRGRCYF